MQRNAVAYRSRRLVASMLLGRRLCETRSMMRVRTDKPNRLSMQAGLRRHDIGFGNVRQKRVGPEELSRAFEYGPKILLSH
jgi:hypothetical protein